MTPKRFPYVLGAVLVALIIALLYYDYHRSNPENMIATSTPVTADLSGAEVRGVPALQAPDYSRPLVFSPTVSTEVRAALNAQLVATKEILDKKPTDFYAWVNLGVVRKAGGDYRGAEEDWLYVAKLYPKSTVPFDNLGALYLDFLKDYAKTEANFKISIKNDPHDINAYQQLFSLYTIYGYKAGTSAAADLIEQGLKDNPGNATLLELQAQLSAH